MIQITLEDDQVRVREVEEKVRRLLVKVPECISRAPEGMLFVYPFSLFLVILQ